MKHFPFHFSRSRFSKSQLTRVVSEFISLNRQRLQGIRPLSVSELERMQQLRVELEMEFEGVPQGALQTAPRTKRRALRVPAQLEARVQNGSQKIEGSVIDLSDGGAFLRLEQRLEPGTPIFLCIARGVNSNEVSVQGVVTWVRDAQNPELPNGVGIRFQNLDRDQQLALTDLVENMLTSL